MRARTARPYRIDLFAPLPLPPTPTDPGPALDRIAPFCAELGLPAPSLPAPPPDDFDARLKAALDSGASVFSFTFGLLPPEAIAAIKTRGMIVMGTATTVAEALALEKAGCDAVVAQGSEAGGHRGTFAGSFEASLVGTIALVPQVADAVRVPVIASGGITDGRGLAAALALGAEAAQIGTAFLAAEETGTSPAYKAAILAAREDQTRVTRAFSGRPARGIVNRFMEAIEPEGEPSAALPFPFQNVATRPLRTEASKRDRAEYLSLWAGQGVRLARQERAGAIVARLAAEAEAVVARLSAG